MSDIYKPQEIELEKWLKRAEEDSKNFQKDVNYLMDKLGVIGDLLFNLTLDNQSSNIAYRSVDVLTGDNVAKGMFHGLCPELESFITLINWMGTSSERKIERVKYFQQLQKFISENKTDQVCKIIGNYRIRIENFSIILVYRASVQIQNREKRFYEWERVPFLKRSAETFAYFPSPMFMSPVKSIESNVSEDRVSHFTLLFKVKSISNRIVRISMYYCTNPHQKETDVIVYDDKLLSNLKTKKNCLFIGLFEDKIYKQKKDYNREFVLLDVSQELDGNDIAGHFITQRLYYNYLKEQNLFICSNDEFEKRCRTVFFQVEKLYSKKVTGTFDFFNKMYLEAYFVKMDNNWYYKPFIFRDLDIHQFKDFITYLSKIKEKPSNTLDILKHVELSRKFGKQKDYLEFLNRYNFYSKRILIDIIKAWGEKWRI